jgi:site-specific DNA-methyltransferase (adenine-specific)
MRRTDEVRHWQHQSRGAHLLNRLYYGDNLTILRKHIKDESVDLVYLDSPFKSNQDYNVLFSERGAWCSIR